MVVCFVGICLFAGWWFVTDCGVFNSRVALFVFLCLYTLLLRFRSYICALLSFAIDFVVLWLVYLGCFSL